MYTIDVALPVWKVAVAVILAIALQTHITQIHEPVNKLSSGGNLKATRTHIAKPHIM
jgi:hypothetical protein